MSDQEREALKAALGVMEQAVSEMGPAARTQNSMLIGERADDMIAAMRPCIRKARAALAAREEQAKTHERSWAQMEQEVENDQARRMESTGRCPCCGADV